MSSVTVYEVTKSGDVVPFAVERNAMAFAPVILGVFMQWHTPGKFWWNTEEVEAFWDIVNAGKLGRIQTFLVKITYDRCWVRRKHWPLAIALLDGFYKQLRGVDGGVDITIARVAAAIERLQHERPEAIGFALRGTSVTPSLWEITDADGEPIRRVNILTAPTCADGQEAWELTPS